MGTFKRPSKTELLSGGRSAPLANPFPGQHQPRCPINMQDEPGQQQSLHSLRFLPKGWLESVICFRKNIHLKCAEQYFLKSLVFKGVNYSGSPTLRRALHALPCCSRGLSLNSGSSPGLDTAFPIRDPRDSGWDPGGPVGVWRWPLLRHAAASPPNQYRKGTSRGKGGRSLSPAVARPRFRSWLRGS